MSAAIAVHDSSGLNTYHRLDRRSSFRVFSEGSEVGVLYLSLGGLAFGVLSVRELDQSFANVYSTTVSTQNLRPAWDRRRSPTNPPLLLNRRRETSRSRARAARSSTDGNPSVESIN